MSGWLAGAGDLRFARDPAPGPSAPLTPLGKSGLEPIRECAMPEYALNSSTLTAA